MLIYKIGNSLRRFAVSASCLLALSALPANSQVTTASIVGTVTDSSGAIVPGAKVTVTNTGTQVKQNTLSNSAGDYVFTFLNPGTYSLTITAPGFKAIEVPSIQLAAGDTSRTNGSLQAGAADQTVTVSAEASLLQRETSALSSVVTEKSVQDLPLNGRNFVNLVQIQPGVNAGSPTAIGSGTRPDDRREESTISANGQNDVYNNQLLDGVDNNERVQGLLGVRPSIDAIAEVKVDTNTFTAEVGRAAGAVVNIITKSGTNALHGSAYEFFRNDIFDARDFFATAGSVPKPEYRQNQFGGSVGGPVRKGKTFFFADAEDNRVIEGRSSGLLTVPTLFEEQNPGNFSDVGGPVIPASALTPTGLAYLRLFPAPNVPGAAAVNNFTSVTNETQYTLTADGRIDQHFNNGDQLYGRYSYNNVHTVIPGPFPSVSELGTTINPGGSFLGFNGPSVTKAHGVIIDYLHAFNQNALIDLKTGYTRIAIASSTLNQGNNVSELFGVQNGNIPSVPGTTGLTPVDFLTGGYASVGDSIYLPINNVNNIFQNQATVSYSHGKHNLKFGAALIRRQINYLQSPYPLGLLFYVGITGNSLGDLLTGASFGYTRSNNLNEYGLRTWEPSGYAQDDWRVTTSLTLNLGVRYDVYTPFTDSHNRYSNFDYETLTLLTEPSRSHVGLDTSYTNFAPRIGFSKSIGAATVVRGGYGISYYPAQTNLSVTLSNPPNVSQSLGIGPAYIGQPLPAPATPDLTNLSGSLSYAPSDLNTSTLQMFNLVMQQQIKENVFTLAYVGETGRHQLFEPQVNIPNPNGPYPNATTSAPPPPPAFLTATSLPNVGPIAGYLPVATSSYNALQASVARRVNHGLAFNANYTWAHSLSDGFSGSGIASGQGLIATNPRYDYGNSTNDIRNRFAISAVYEIPLGKGDSGLRGILSKGYSVNLIDYWQTGSPFTVVSALARINLPNTTTDRPDVTGASLTPSQRNNSRFFNIVAFTPQAAGTAGDEHFNQLFGPHQRRADLSIFKTTTLENGVALQFRAECYNISNTPNFSITSTGYTISSFTPGPAHGAGNPISTVGVLPGDIPTNAGGFGQISSTTSNVNPRQFQFALKVLF